MNNRTLFIALGVLALIILCVLCYWLWSRNDGVLQLPSTAEQISTSASGKAFYTTQELTSSCEFEGCDLRLLFVDENGASNVIVDNLTALFRESTDETRDFVDISPFYLPENGDSLIFIETIGSSACCKLTRFSISQKTFDRYRSLSTMRGEMASPDNSMILEMSSDGSALTIYDTLTNNRIATVSAGPGETFVKEIGGYGGEPIGNYEWAGNLGIYYSVYATSQALSGESGMMRTEIERRHFRLP
jgi:hypothetical protein